MNIGYILLLLAVVLLPALLFWVFMNRMGRTMAGRARQQLENFDVGSQKMQAGTARVLNKTEEIRPDAKGIAKVDLQLEVRIPEKAPYHVATVWLVEVASLENVAPGKDIPVKVDVKRPVRVYPDAPWARPWLFGK